MNTLTSIAHVLLPSYHLYVSCCQKEQPSHDSSTDMLLMTQPFTAVILCNCLFIRCIVLSPCPHPSSPPQFLSRPISDHFMSAPVLIHAYFSRTAAMFRSLKEILAHTTYIYSHMELLPTIYRAHLALSTHSIAYGLEAKCIVYPVLRLVHACSHSKLSRNVISLPHTKSKHGSVPLRWCDRVLL